LRERRAVLLDERLPRAWPAVVDDPGELALSRPRVAGKQYVHLQRGEERRLTQHRNERRAPADYCVESEGVAERSHRVLAHRVRSALEHPIGERSEMAREDLGALAVLLREGAALLGALQVHDPAWRVIADRRAENRLDTSADDALAFLESGIGKRGS